VEIEIGIEVEIEIKVAFCTDVVQKEEAGDLTILAESSTLSGHRSASERLRSAPALPRTLVQGIFPQWRAKGDRWE
jgi:hypothetical protein